MRALDRLFDWRCVSTAPRFKPIMVRYRNNVRVDLIQTDIEHALLIANCCAWTPVAVKEAEQA